MLSQARIPAVRAAARGKGGPCLHVYSTNYIVNNVKARPGPRPRSGSRAKAGRSRAVPPPDTRDAIFAAAAEAFSARGFDGVTVDDIARAAGVNKAMIYYHYADKLALYRGVVAEMLAGARDRIAGIAASADSADVKIRRFVDSFVRLTA